MGNLNTIETGHLPKLEREMIAFAIENGDVLECVEMAVLTSEATDECLAAIEDGFRMMFEDEVTNHVEENVEEEDTEDAGDWCGIELGYNLSNCFNVKVTRDIDQVDEPDFETCAIRALAAYAIEAYPDGLNGLYVELAENRKEGEL